eukprot:COSAG01_NODE_449_length_16915_cov_23.001903_2_plen_85_part_00
MPITRADMTITAHVQQAQHFHVRQREEDLAVPSSPSSACRTSCKRGESWVKLSRKSAGGSSISMSVNIAPGGLSGGGGVLMILV